MIARNRVVTRSPDSVHEYILKIRVIAPPGQEGRLFGIAKFQADLSCQQKFENLNRVECRPFAQVVIAHEKRKSPPIRDA